MKEVDPNLKYFSVLSDLLLLSIRNKETKISRTLSDFFYTAFRRVRDKFVNKAVVYPELYYELVYKAIEELAILKEKRNYALEHRTAGEKWLLGDLPGKEISETTYSWMWKNLLLAVQYQQDDLIVNHWETCHQYYTYCLPYIYEKYDDSVSISQVSNQKTVDKRLAERFRFKEFHYALGGLLTYKERYACIKRLFRYTQSQPPTYELLPESMYEIFRFYFDVRDPYDIKYTWISNKYPFPELSGLNAGPVIKKWICSYMALLFLRQYTIVPYLSTMQPLEYPQIPRAQSDIKAWIDGLDFFKLLVSEHLKNKRLLKTLNLDFITPEWCIENKKPYPIAFIETFKSNLEKAYHVNALNLPISTEKETQFENATKKIIELEIEKLEQINNKTEIPDDNADKWYINGHRMLQSKDAFSENPEAHHIEFETYLARVVTRSLYEVFGATFFYKKTKSFLLKNEDFFEAINRLEIDNNFAIVNFGINLDYFIDNLRIPGLSKDAYNGITIYSFRGSQLVRDSMFILQKTDFPSILTLPIADDEISKYSLKKISSSIELYAKVIDLNKTTDEVYNENKQDKTDDEIRKSVLLNIIITTEIKWKKNIEVIQLRQYSEFLQQGITNKLGDIKPFNERNSDN